MARLKMLNMTFCVQDKTAFLHNGFQFFPLLLYILMSLQFLSMIDVVMEFASAALGLEDVPCQTFIRAILQQLHGETSGCCPVFPRL